MQHFSEKWKDINKKWKKAQFEKYGVILKYSGKLGGEFKY